MNHPVKKMKYLMVSALLTLIHSFPTYGISESYKKFLIALPMVSLGKEAPLRLEYNLRGKGGIALEWFSWGGESTQEELMLSEKEVFPEDRLSSAGRSITLMLGRYSHGPDMSGFHWGLGIGYKKVAIDWLKSPSFIPFNQQLSLEGLSQVRHRATLEGMKYNSRLGYRFVSDSMGLVSGLYMSLSHFSANVRDRFEMISGAQRLSHSDTLYLKRNLKLRLHIGMEFGWAF